MTAFVSQLEKLKSQQGFIAALDQSGGSTPKALEMYGITADGYRNDDEMFSLIHEMRTRIVTSKAFNGDRVLGAILFENTLDRHIQGKTTSQYLWEDKRVIPFLKIDKGLAPVEQGVQLMKDIAGLPTVLAKAKENNVFGTKMRSVIKLANPQGIEKLVQQQFDFAKMIMAAGLVPIIEPEVDINSPEKAEAETLLRSALLSQLEQLDSDQLLMLKLSLPEVDNFYRELTLHNNVLKVVALSGGYSREEANRRCRNNTGMVASFSRALVEGLSAKQSDEEFNAQQNASIQSIFQASTS